MKKMIIKFTLAFVLISSLAFINNSNNKISAYKATYHDALWGYNITGWKVMGAHYYVEGDAALNARYSQWNENWANWPNWFSEVTYENYVAYGNNYNRMIFTMNGGIKTQWFEGIVRSYRTSLTNNY